MNTRYGQYHLADAPSVLASSIHLHQGEELKEVMHTPPLGVLDQQDLFAQGIDTSHLVPGAQAVDALGSCTAQAATAAVSVLGESAFAGYLKATLGVDDPAQPVDWGNVKLAEEAAILFYHKCTDQTGAPDQEWPPTDCGSTGSYIVGELETMGLVTGALIASGSQNIVSLLQHGPLLVGQPFLYAWEQPPPDGVIDGDGSYATLKKQLAEGVAGGHETLLYGIETLTMSHSGQVDPHKTIVRFRNSWGASWGLEGDYLAHLSTYVALASNVDYRLLQVAA